MSFSESSTDDLDELCERLSQGGWEFEALQLSGGPAGFRSQGVRLPGLSVLRLRYGQALEIHERKSDGWLSLGLVLEASGAPRQGGCSIQADHLVVRTAGDDREFTLPPGCVTLNVDVDPELVGRYEGATGLISTRGAERLRRDFIAACRTLIREAAGVSTESAPGRDRLESASVSLQDAMRALLAAGAVPAARPALERERFHLTRRARRLLEESDGSLSIPQLARELGVSQRALFRAFQHCIGVGPRQLEQLRGLHDFRGRLLRKGAGRGKVAEAAAEAGFSHLGRLSYLYRRHFGERPSETARRNRRG